MCYFLAHHYGGVWDDLAIKVLHDLAKIILSDFGMASFRVINH